MQGKLLKAMSREHFKEGLENPTTQEIVTSLMTFSEFNSSSVKNRQLEVREMFAKHLLQIHGVSVDKARAVVDKVGHFVIFFSELMISLFILIYR